MPIARPMDCSYAQGLSAPTSPSDLGRLNIDLARGRKPSCSCRASGCEKRTLVRMPRRPSLGHPAFRERFPNADADSSASSKTDPAQVRKASWYSECRRGRGAHRDAVSLKSAFTATRAVLSPYKTIYGSYFARFAGSRRGVARQLCRAGGGALVGDGPLPSSHCARRHFPLTRGRRRSLPPGDCCARDSDIASLRASWGGA